MGAGPSMERLLYDSVRAGEDLRVRYLHGEGVRINVNTSRFPPAFSLSLHRTTLNWHHLVC